jgi:PAS domain S-box-containing protein
MKTMPMSYEELLEENERLRQRLEEAEGTVEAIRGGEVDAVVVYSSPSEQVYTLEGADRPYRLLVEAMQQGVATLDREGTILYCNPYFAELVKTPAEMVMGVAVRDFVIEADRPAWADMLTRAGTASAQCEVQLRRDDSFFPAALHLSALPLRGALCLLVTDLTQQKRYEEWKRVEELLRASEARSRRLAALVESSEDAIVSKSLDGIIRTWNAAAQRLFGYTAEQAIGKHISLIIPADRAEEEAQILARLRAGERVEHFDTVRVRSDGRLVEVSLTISPIRDESGRVIGASKIARDIAEQKKLEAELRQYAADLGKADRRKDEFLAMLAHELRNPLAPIRSALHVVQMRGPERRQAVRQAWDVMERQVENLVRLVDDLLDISRISQGKIKLERRPVDVATIVSRAVESSRPLIDARKHELAVTLPEQPLRVEADVTRMAQVILNLLNNAAKYTPEGGRIHVTVVKGREEVAIRVKDTGMGIPAEILPKLFDLFAQEERTLNRAEGGLGIGLALVRRLTTLHGGTVQASSAGPGQGSEFVVRLPLLAEGPCALAPAKNDEDNERAKVSVRRRILLVDDNKDSADSLAMLLRLWGHDVRTVADGREALAVAPAYRPDLVLLDIGLPGLDGYEVARRLRTEPWIGQTVLVALTGYASDEDRRQARAAGFAHHMVKPVDFDALRRLLAALEPTTD